jgi:type I restriction enzyme S subunit
MKQVKLKEVSKYIRGITFKPQDIVDPYSKDSVVCMRTKNVQIILDESDLIAVPPSFVKRDEQYLREGDLLVSSANSWNLVGKTCYVDKLSYKATAGGFISILRPTKNIIEPRYLYYWLSSSRTQHYVRLCGRQTTNICNLDKNRFLNIKIPLPPIATQRKIASILDKADEIRRKRQEAIKLTEELGRSLFLDMFGDPVTNPKGWDFITLGSQILSLKYGTNSKCHDIQETGDLPVLRIPNIVGAKISWNDLKFATVSDKEKKDLLLQKNDLLFVRSNGNPEYIARCALFEDSQDILYASYLIRGRLKSSSILKAAFIRDVISFPTYRAILIQQARTTAGNYNINTQGLKSLKIIKPSLEEQEKYLNLKKAIDERINFQFEFSTESENLFNSLLQRAFKGEL